MVLTAGTSDLPVAEEAALTASVLGAGAEVVAEEDVSRRRGGGTRLDALGPRYRPEGRR